MADDLRARIVAEARTWLDTPWSHQQRQKGIGVDCPGPVIETCRVLGLSDFDMRDYERLPNGQFLSICRREMTEISVSRIQPADVVVMAWANQLETQPSHIAMVVPYPYGEHVAVLHASTQFRKVCEHRLTPEWRRRIVAAFKLPGVD